jgi:hypothetical protein
MEAGHGTDAAQDRRRVFGGRVVADFAGRKRMVLDEAMLDASGGRCEIRTHGAVAGTPVFKTGALDHSANLPDSRRFQSGHASQASGLENNNIAPM